MSDTKSNLAKAIIAVMKEVKGMEKNSRVGEGTKSAYNGTKDRDVKEIFNTSLAKNGLCILPIEVLPLGSKVDRWEDPKYKNMKQSVFTEVRTKYLLLHESGESQVLAGYGQGVDSQDKGAGKATTYALKNCLLYTFLTPVGKIDDTDTTHSDETSYDDAESDKNRNGKSDKECIAGKTVEKIKDELDKSEDPALVWRSVRGNIKDVEDILVSEVKGICDGIVKYLKNENS